MKHAINQEMLSETQSLNELRVKCAIGESLAMSSHPNLSQAVTIL